jgi:hypothetical protein
MRPPQARRRPGGPDPTLAVVRELLRRWDDRDPPPERFTSRAEEERVKRARAATLLDPPATDPDPDPDLDPCADCPQEATA